MKLKSDDGDVVLKSQASQHGSYFSFFFKRFPLLPWLFGGRNFNFILSNTSNRFLRGGVVLDILVMVCRAGFTLSLPAKHKMLGQLLITKQTGAAGKPVNTVLVAQKMKLINEMYFAILLDRASAGPMVIACSEGGTSIEDLAEKHPEKIIRMKIDIKTGLTEAQARDLAERLDVKGSISDAVTQLQALYDVFINNDCTMLEINPLAETNELQLIAADAKLNFDDNAEYRQKDLFALRDHAQEDPREVTAGKFDLNYIGLDGNIGCMVNGAGLAMATMDIISLHGAAPANFLDVGGNASEQQVVEAFKILTADAKVKALLVNIFGGIMKCDVIASGIVSAAKQVGLQVPLVVRLEGTNVEAGKEILEKSGMDIIAAADLDDAAKKAVAALS
jgi:succinyl-CoA synthetase beta subunit